MIIYLWLTYIYRRQGKQTAGRLLLRVILNQSSSSPGNILTGRIKGIEAIRLLNLYFCVVLFH